MIRGQNEYCESHAYDTCRIARYCDVGNPITKVRISAKRLREPDVLSPAELASRLAELELRERTMVILAGSTGLRRSELVALIWRDIDLELMQVNVRRCCVRNHFGDTKTEASRKPVLLHPSVVKCLQTWRKESPYPCEENFIFPSVRREGKLTLRAHAMMDCGRTFRRSGWEFNSLQFSCGSMTSLACNEGSSLF